MKEFIPVMKKAIRALHNREHTHNSRQRKASKGQTFQIYDDKILLENFQETD